MTRRLTNTSTYRVETDRAVYAVNMEKLKNTPSGCARFKASVITLQVKSEPEPGENFYTTVWTFQGHYLHESEEAA